MSTFTLNNLDKEIILSFVNKVLSAFSADLKGVILYGSKARGDGSNESDIDLLLLFREVDRNLSAQIRHIAHDISLTWDVCLSPKLVDLATWEDMFDGPYPLFNEIFKDGLPVYGRKEIFTPLAHKDIPPLYDEAAAVTA